MALDIIMVKEHLELLCDLFSKLRKITMGMWIYNFSFLLLQNWKIHQQIENQKGLSMPKVLRQLQFNNIYVCQFTNVSTHDI